MRHVVVLSLGIHLISVMLESPSYTIWEGDNPREELPDKTSKDARVGTLSLRSRRHILKRPTQ